MSEDCISNLALEILSHIFSFLSEKDLCNICEVCKQWNETASDNLLWYKRCYQKGITNGQSIMNEDRNYWKNIFTLQARSCAKWRGKDLEAPVIVSMHNYAVMTDLVIHNNWTACSLDNGTIVVVDLIANVKKHTFRLNDKGSVWCLVAFSMKGEDFLASGGNDGFVRVWDISSGKCTAELENNDLKSETTDRSRMVRCLAVTETDCADESLRLISGGRYFIILVWDVVTKLCIHVLQGHTGAIRCVKANKDIVVSASYDKTIKVWSLKTGDLQHDLTQHMDRVYTIHLAQEFIVSSSLDQTLKVWHIGTGKCKHTLYGHASLTKDLAMDKEEGLIVSGNADNTVKVWSMESGECIRTLSGEYKHIAALTSVKVVRNAFIVSSSADGIVKLWRLADGAFIRDILNLSHFGGTSVIVWTMVATDDYLVCATGSSVATLPSKLYKYNFSVADYRQTE